MGMRGAGTDATHLFDQVHRWVNVESMLKACVVGKLVDGGKPPQLNPSNLLTAPQQKQTHLNVTNKPKKNPPNNEKVERAQRWHAAATKPNCNKISRQKCFVSEKYSQNKCSYPKSI